MELHQVNEIIQCLPKDRTFFYYFDDRYAIYLLTRQLKGGEKSIKTLKKTQFSKLLEKEVIRNLLADSGDGVLRANALKTIWPAFPHVFSLTLGSWGCKKDYRWDQVSRPGSNLVLQLNFSGEINYEFQRFMPLTANELNDWGHPYHSHKTTLAWARLDIDFNSNTVLIEEIQSDWVREMNWLYKFAKSCKKESFSLWYEQSFKTRSVISFYEQVIEPATRQWAEAMLMSSLWFCWEELGIKHVYLHTFNTGCVLKNIKDKKFRPPRSIYTDLPKKFCFEKTAETPEMLLKETKVVRRLKRIPSPEWHYLAA